MVTVQVGKVGIVLTGLNPIPEVIDLIAKFQAALMPHNFHLQVTATKSMENNAFEWGGRKYLFKDGELISIAYFIRSG